MNKMKNKKAIFNPLYLLIILIFYFVMFFIVLIILNQTEDKACAKLGYDKYYQVGSIIGICENDKGFINVKMICENDKYYQILLGQMKCKASKVKEDG